MNDLSDKLLYDSLSSNNMIQAFNKKSSVYDRRLLFFTFIVLFYVNLYLFRSRNYPIPPLLVAKKWRLSKKLLDEY